MNLRNIYQTTRIMILNPGAGWNSIFEKSVSRQKAIQEYLFPMALLIALGSLVGSIFEGEIYDYSSVGYVLFNSLISFLIIFLEVYLSGWLITELAAFYHHDPDNHHIFILVIYSHAPFFLSLTFIKIFPLLFFVAVIGFYSFYLFWIGLKRIDWLKDEDKLIFFLVSGLIMVLTYTLLTVVFNSIYDVIIDQFVNFGSR